MLSIIQNALSQNAIDEIYNQEIVNASKNKLEHSNNVYFDIPLSNSLKTELASCFQIDLIGIEKIPMRWIKGDTLAHIDKQKDNSSFAKTYLLYLSDSVGSLVVDNQEYPISKNVAYTFSEGVSHATRDTNDKPRLLLGPMSENLVAVGAPSTYISQPGGTTVYIQDIGGNVNYSLDQVNWQTLYWPCYITNTSLPIADYIEVKFLSDITLYDSYNYFVCQSEKIQFGSTSLNNDGSRPVININYDYYDGLIQNGDENNGGYNNIRIYNLLVNGNGYSTQIGGGWLCKKYFGNGVSNNYIINCSSNGTINGGGIVGEYAAANGGQLYIIGCSSSGQILQDEAGGIVGRYTGYNNGFIDIISCWSSGIISGNKSGGIVGAEGNSVTITNCYSTGNISGTYAGGIAGLNNGNGSCTISNCYSTGNILADYCGGIAGAIDPYSNMSLSITNCYYIGTIGNFVGSGAIVGPINTSNFGNFNISISNSYASGYVFQPDGYIIGSINTESYTYDQPNGYINSSNCYSEIYRSINTSWSSSNANTVLLGVPLSQPGLGISWFSTGLNQPYKIRNMGYSPYTTNNIDNSNNLVRNIGSSIAAGSVSLGGYYFNNYSIIAITGGVPGSYNTINIDPSSGTVSTTSGTAPGTYTVYLYSEGSYNLSSYTLIVSQAPCLIDNTMVLTPKGYINVKYLKKGDYVTTSDNRNVKIKHIFSSYIAKATETLYPCKIEKNSIAIDYPKNDLYISQNHLINYGNSWILPRLFFPLDTNRNTFNYYHIKLENYKTDHLVIDDGVVVESLASNDEECLEYINRARTSVELYRILSEKNNCLLEKDIF